MNTRFVLTVDPGLSNADVEVEADEFEVRDGHLLCFRQHDLVAAFQPGAWASVQRAVREEAIA